LKSAMEKAGFKVVNFSDVGWVHFFTKEKARTPSDLKKLRLFINADDPDSEKLYLDLGFRPVPLGVTDLLTSLKTGLIDAFDVPPLFALSDQSFGVAKHMIDVKWAPLIGATVIDTKVWDRIETPTAAEMIEWRAMAKTARDKLRERGIVPAADLDEAVRLSTK
jgi:TRAP-type C4-dicarboxylate transport system substrate-binding protein